MISWQIYKEAKDTSEVFEDFSYLSVTIHTVAKIKVLGVEGRNQKSWPAFKNLSFYTRNSVISLLRKLLPKFKW